MTDTVFFIASSFTILMVTFMIFQTNPISSALCLVASFFGMAVLYLTLQAHFVATLQILVYAGAIMVLFIFVIMLLNLKPQELTQDTINTKRLAVIVLGLALAGLMCWQFLRLPVSAETQFASTEQSFGTAKEVGKLMFDRYVVAFEILGFLLLMGIVGAILLAQRDPEQKDS